MTDFATHVRAQVATYQDTRRYIYVREQGGELTEQVLTYTDLDREARSIAAWLARHAHRARPVLLLYRDAIDFLPAFLGCIYAGVVAVPAPMPTDERSLQRVAGIFDDANMNLVLTTSSGRDWIDEAGWADRLSCFATDAGPLGDPDAWRMPQLDSETVAFLQYTSGSTGRHKGVVVTHGNLLHNQAEIAKAIGADDESTVAGWLPHFHDMGLVGMLLHPIYCGADSVTMSPVTFLKRPHRWLEMLDRYRARVTAAPNFAYELLARRVTDEQLAGLDLSSVRVAMNGAEPVRARTLDLVAERLRPAGFSPEALLPSYGMAEMTLCATAGQVGAPHVRLDVDAAALERDVVRPARETGGVRLVSSGRPIDVDLRVVHPRTRRVLPENRVGEIWIRGRSVAAGYWNRRAETEETFQARTADGSGPYLRTGDLGFLAGGELFVTGRHKDLVIVNGRNLYPQDIEEVVRGSHPALAHSAGVAFGVDTGREQIAVVQGIQPAQVDGVPLPELAARIKAAVARVFDVAAPSVVLVRRTGVHLTTSGKVRRRSMRAAFLANRLEAALHEDLDPAVRRLRTDS